MELAAVALQALNTQQQIALQVVKQAAEQEQALVDMIVKSTTRGGSLDISV
ncbi:MAG TPA: putative motility protein [Patescibacteria group bacterium]|nr:putative motility protein [Patescibacteria group bacterium]